MNIKHRLNQVEKSVGVGGDYCRCFEPVSKIFPKELKPAGYTPSQCFICRKEINQKRIGGIKVLTPKVEI